MPEIKTDDNKYEITTFSEEAKTQLARLQFVDGELKRL